MDTIYKRTIETNEFTSWYSELKDRKVQMRITQRIDRLRQGNPGDVESLGNGVYELRLHFGPGYRIYYAIEGNTLIILLLGGTKRRQQKDIEKSKEILNTILQEAI